MRADICPAQVPLLTVSGWVNRHQTKVIACLAEENRVRKERRGGRAPCLTDDQRRRLAAKEQRLCRKASNQVATILTSDTSLRWRRSWIALEWAYETKWERAVD